MIIALTGFEFFYRDAELIYFILFPISSIAFWIKKESFDAKSFGLIFLFVLITAIHCYKFNMSYFFAFTTFIRFTTYYFIASIVSVNIDKIFINIIYFFSCISLFFYILINISDSLYEFLLYISNNITSLSIKIDNDTSPNQTLILYTVPFENLFKNNGPFWEPGMFAVFLNIALALNVISTKNLFKIKNIIFIIASISTFSASSFITTFIIIVYYYIIIIPGKIKTIIFLFIVPFVALPIYNSEYVKGKLELNLESVEKAHSRFGATLIHYDQIRRFPWFGLGTKTNEDQENMLGIITVSPNGLTNLIRFYGIPFGIFYYILLYKSSSVLGSLVDKKKSYKWLIYIVLLTVSFSQDVTTRHFYYMLLFLPFVNQKKYLSNKFRIQDKDKLLFTKNK